jgi:hypothetical protein
MRNTYSKFIGNDEGKVHLLRSVLIRKDNIATCRIISRQRLGEDIPGATNTHAAIR